MTDNRFYMSVAECRNYTDRDAYISDLALSSIWGDAPGDDIPQGRIDALGEIWDACHRSIKDIASAAGLSVRALAIRFCIPQRTVENWASGARECPIYTRLMMQECLGLLRR